MQACHAHDLSLAEGALDFAASGNLHTTHGLHAFAARLPPPLARWVIETFTDPGDFVLDPMCGSGTALLEALLAGRESRGLDLDPLARLIATAKATLVPPAEVNAAAEAIRGALARAQHAEWRPEIPRLDYWFRDDVIVDLSRLRAAVVAATAEGSAVRDLAWAVFSSLIIARTSVANARDLVHSRHHHRQWEKNPDAVGRFLRGLDRAQRMMRQLEAQLAHVPSPRSARVIEGDARDLPIPDGMMDLTFFSPPYVSALDYPRAHAFAVAWLSDVLDVEPRVYRENARRYIGTDRAALLEASRERPLPPATGLQEVDAVVERLSDDPSRCWTVHRYFRDMSVVLQEAARVTRPGGHVVLVVCPSNIRRVNVPTHEVFCAIAPEVTSGALEVEAMYARSIHDRRRVMPYLQSAFGERMRTEYVIVARRMAKASRDRTTVDR